MTEHAQKQNTQDKKHGDPLDKLDKTAESLGAVSRKEQDQVAGDTTQKERE